MSVRRRRFVAKVGAAQGWRIWDNLQKKWWGEHYENHPERLLAELNGEKRPSELASLQKRTAPKR